MSNCAIYIKNSDQIEQFVIDAVLIDRNSDTVRIIGNPGKRTVKRSLFDLKWTNDIANPVFDESGKQIGYDKTVSELASDGENVSITTPNRTSYHRAVKLRARIADMGEQDIADHVDQVFGGLNSTQCQSLKYLYLAVWGQIQMDNARR